MTNRNELEPRMNQEGDNSFFQTATIGTFYQAKVPNSRYLELNEEQQARWFKSTALKREVIEAEKLAYARTNGIEWVDLIMARRKEQDGPYCLVETPAPQLTYWFPYFTERQVIASLAQALVEPGVKPTILEAGCGSGLVSRLLAAEDTLRVIGADTDMVASGSTRIPPTPGDVHFIVANFWDVVEKFSPCYSEEMGKRRRLLLDAVREEYTRKPVIELISAGVAAVNGGEVKRLNNELGSLQELSHDFLKPSPVDLVLCSFMETGVDLTVPIRDGIHPKAIVYIRPCPPLGSSGAGDYYFPPIYDDETGEYFDPTADTAISYNPGTDYHTLARWFTHNVNNWWYSVNPPHFWIPFDTEVVIQLRNDVVLKACNNPLNRKYPFDENIETGFRQQDELENFLGGIEKARTFLSG